MPDDASVRAQFADWVRQRLQLRGLTEAEAGRAIKRRPGWLDRFVERRYARDELTMAEANQIVRLLGGDPDVVLPGMDVGRKSRRSDVCEP